MLKQDSAKMVVSVKTLIFVSSEFVSKGNFCFKEPNASKPTWDSMTERSGRPESPPRRRPQAFRPFDNMEEYMPSYVFGPGPVGGLSTVSSTGEKLETSREISRRLDCKLHLLLKFFLYVSATKQFNTFYINNSEWVEGIKYVFYS